jgi:hypothetical protein
MVLVQLLLPATRAGAVAHETHVAHTRAELTAKFGGVTAYQRAPALGAWVNDDGRLERDDVIMVEVVADTFARSWWRAYRTELEARFAQTEIHVRALSIMVP